MARESEAPSGARLRRGALSGLYLTILVVGFVLGTRGWSLLSLSGGPERSTPLARVGFVLTEPSIEGEESEWEQLRQDLRVVRDGWPEEDRGVFDLVVAVHGFHHRGEPQWDRAQELCTALGWTRCDRDALSELRKRSRP